jgi:hypothetical protein
MHQDNLSSKLFFFFDMSAREVYNMSNQVSYNVKVLELNMYDMHECWVIRLSLLQWPNCLRNYILGHCHSTESGNLMHKVGNKGLQ